MRQRLEAATAAVVDVLERYDLTISETSAILIHIARRYEAIAKSITKSANVRDFKGYEVDAYGEVKKPADK